MRYHKGSLRTAILAVVLLPSIAALLWYADQRNKQFEGKAQACSEKCTAQGYRESQFKWAALKDGDCICR